ncbi:hypothetical protein BDZ89DRAFT_1049623 [Hymenopellis radicata]|nr:hypothetical protein BDZ89DRAFT_1049623 [Hymenopellis radicata]
MAMPSFNVFIEGDENLQFSKAYFTQLTLFDAAMLFDTYPTILPLNSIGYFEFSKMSAEDSVALSPDHSVPHKTDLLKITNTWETEYRHGFVRNWELEIRLFMNVNENAECVRLSCELRDTLVANSILPDAMLACLDTQSIKNLICGFKDEGLFPLWQLRYLVQQDYYVPDSVFNGVAELEYFTAFATTPGLEYPIHLFLSTHFLENVRRLYRGKSAQIPSNVEALRRRLEMTTIDSISISDCNNNHFDAYHWDTNSEWLAHGDSLGNEADPDILLPMLWAFATVDLERYEIFEDVYEDEMVPLQPLGSADCGIIALNWMHRKRGGSDSIWTFADGLSRRHRLLRNFLIYHHVARLCEISGKLCITCSYKKAWNYINSSNLRLDHMIEKAENLVT